MTIGAAFHCWNGLAILSDTQVGDDEYKFYITKVQSLEVGSGSFVCTYAGSPDRARTVISRLEKELAVIPHVDSDAYVEEAVRKVLSKFKWTRRGPNLSMLIGYSLPRFVTGGERRLLKTANDNVEIGGAQEFIGCGDSELLRFLQRTLRDLNFVDIRQASVWGIYILLCVKLYVQGCGGETDLTIIRGPGRVEKVPQGRIRKIGKVMAEAVGELSNFLAYLTYPSFKQEERNAGFGKVQQRIEKLWIQHLVDELLPE